MSGPNPFGHGDLRVASMQGALPFYEALLPELGFTHRFHGPEWKVWAAEAPRPGRKRISWRDAVPPNHPATGTV